MIGIKWCLGMNKKFGITACDNKGKVFFKRLQNENGNCLNFHLAFPDLIMILECIYSKRAGRLYCE